MTNYATGHQAEKTVAVLLREQGYEIVELNWKTKQCEIDIVARKQDYIYFIEVKYRKNNLQGSGLDYITPKKLKQMEFGAELWVSSHNWGGNYQLLVASVSPQGTEIIEIE